MVLSCQCVDLYILGFTHDPWDTQGQLMQWYAMSHGMPWLRLLEQRSIIKHDAIWRFCFSYILCTSLHIFAHSPCPTLFLLRTSLIVVPAHQSSHLALGIGPVEPCWAMLSHVEPWWNQWEFQDPKLEVNVPYFWPYFVGIFPQK